MTPRLTSHLVAKAYGASFTLVLCVVVLPACGTQFGVGPDWGTVGSGPTKTCSGQAKASNARAFDLLFVEKASSCTVPNSQGGILILSPLANSKDEAKKCALKTVGDESGVRFDVYEAAALRPFAFIIADYSKCEFGNPNSNPPCHTSEVWHVSASGAMACTSLYWEGLLETAIDPQGNLVINPSAGSCRITDVSSSVISFVGGGYSIDYGAWDNRCPRGCSP